MQSSVDRWSDGVTGKKKVDADKWSLINSIYDFISNLYYIFSKNKKRKKHTINSKIKENTLF